MKTSTVLLLFLSCAAVIRAEVKLPALFSDHLVVQANGPVPVWGWAKAGADGAAEDPVFYHDEPWG